MPRSGKPQRLPMLPQASRATGSRPVAHESQNERLLLVLNRNRAAALALAGVLARAAVVAGLATALALAVVLALALVLGAGGAAALALARVLAGAAGVAGLTAALALTVVHALAGMLVASSLLLIGGERLGAGGHAGHDGAHDLRELSPIHSFLLTGTPGRRGPKGPRPCDLRLQDRRPFLSPGVRPESTPFLRGPGPDGFRPCLR